MLVGIGERRCGWIFCQVFKKFPRNFTATQVYVCWNILMTFTRKIYISFLMKWLGILIFFFLGGGAQWEKKTLSEQIKKMRERFNWNVLLFVWLLHNITIWVFICNCNLQNSMFFLSLQSEQIRKMNVILETVLPGYFENITFYIIFSTCSLVLRATLL